MPNDDRLLDFIMSKTKSWRNEPEPAPDPVGSQGYTGLPLGWRPPPSPDAIADEPDQLEEEERAARREPPTELEALTEDAVEGWFASRKLVKLEDLEELDVVPDEPGVRATVQDFIQAVYDSEDELAEAGETVAGRLHWAAAGASEAEWRAACEASGWPEDVRPGLGDLPRDVQLDSLRLSLEAEAARLRERGRYIE